MRPGWRIPYAVAAVVLLAGLALGLQPVYMAIKPLMMIILLLHFITSTVAYPAWRRLVIMALVFSWAGDVFLVTPGGFVAGLASFLVAHLFYIAAYQKTGAGAGRLQAAIVPLFALYGGLLLWVIHAGLQDLKIPVFLYALVLLFMGVWAFKRRGGTNSPSFTLVATGAVLFVLSDSLIAVNRFFFALPAERILVMSIYLTAQYLIVQGLIKHGESA